jgi:hypothetical protein
VTSRKHLLGVVASLSLVICACGGATATPASSPTPITSVAALMLTPAEYTTAVSLIFGAHAVRVTDAKISGQAGTDERLFFASDGSTLAKVQLFVLHRQAADFYSFLLNNGCPPGGHTAFTHLKIGSAQKADEFGCLKNPGIRVAFEQTYPQGLIIGDALTSVASGAEAIARAESAKITQITGV